MKVAPYIRVSSKGQELENQRAFFKEYIKKSGWTVFKWYEDVISGQEDSRPKYDELFRDAHKKLFDVVLFFDITRFSRSGTLFTLQKLKELDNLGIKWHSYNDPYLSTAGQWKDMIISVLATVAKIERDNISSRTKLAFTKDKNNKTIARKSGKRVGRNAIPQDVIDEVKKRLVKKEPYSKIHNEVTYKTKFGKIHKISKAKISEIANLCSEIGGGK